MIWYHQFYYTTLVSVAFCNIDPKFSFVSNWLVIAYNYTTSCDCSIRVTTVLKYFKCIKECGYRYVHHFQANTLLGVVVKGTRNSSSLKLRTKPHDWNDCLTLSVNFWLSTACTRGAISIVSSTSTVTQVL